MYSIYVEDWLAVYRREQFHFVQLEEFSASPEEHTNRIFKFLNLGKPYGHFVIYNLQSPMDIWLFCCCYFLKLRPVSTSQNLSRYKLCSYHQLVPCCYLQQWCRPMRWWTDMHTNAHKCTQTHTTHTHPHTHLPLKHI